MDYLKYPISWGNNISVSEFFLKILRFHIPLKKYPRKILDPTCGNRNLWKHYNRPTLSKSFGDSKDLNEYNITFSDIRNLGQKIVSDFRELDFKPETFDGIIFDPPYFFGIEDSDDPRSEDYGGYNQTYEELERIMIDASKIFPNWLKPSGKFVLKCSDQYYNPQRKFYFHHIRWAEIFSELLDPVDFFVYAYHRISPTAYQVKDRPCSVIANTYFMIFKMKEK